ncbi:MAG: hypothetical protein AAF943_17220 [Pseudomonadota bacterium]
MTYDPDSWNIYSSTPPDDLNSPDQYEYPTLIDPDTGHPYVENFGDLGHVVWVRIPRHRNARTGDPVYGPRRVGQVVFTGGRSADGSPTRAR